MEVESSTELTPFSQNDEYVSATPTKRRPSGKETVHKVNLGAMLDPYDSGVEVNAPDAPELVDGKGELEVTSLYKVFSFNTRLAHCVDIHQGHRLCRTYPRTVQDLW